MLIALGKILYFNEAAKASDYFAKIGYECPAMSNPADYFMTIMSPENAGDEEEENYKPKTEAELFKEYKKKINYLCDQYNSSDLKNDHTFKSPDVTAIHSTEI